MVLDNIRRTAEVKVAACIDLVVLLELETSATNLARICPLALDLGRRALDHTLYYLVGFVLVVKLLMYAVSSIQAPLEEQSRLGRCFAQAPQHQNGCESS